MENVYIKIYIFYLHRHLYKVPAPVEWTHILIPRFSTGKDTITISFTAAFYKGLDQYVLLSGKK